eukprot:4399213-Amphidinium_carterae.4
MWMFPRVPRGWLRCRRPTGPGVDLVPYCILGDASACAMNVDAYHMSCTNLNLRACLGNSQLSWRMEETMIKAVSTLLGCQQSLCAGGSDNNGSTQSVATSSTGKGFAALNSSSGSKLAPAHGKEAQSSSIHELSHFIRGVLWSKL